MKATSNMLLDDFYTIRHLDKEENGTYSVKIKLNPNHILYQGHFPEQPVVPGVCMLQFIKEVIEQLQETPLQYTRISSCKFLCVINPVENPEIELLLKAEDTENGQIEVQAKGVCNEKEFIKLKALLIRK